jgi:hypothetical protein
MENKGFCGYDSLAGLKFCIYFICKNDGCWYFALDTGMYKTGTVTGVKLQVLYFLLEEQHLL